MAKATSAALHAAKDALNATMLIGRGLYQGQLSTETGAPWIGTQGRPMREAA